MSLQVWLPLNGDLKNQGLDPMTFSNTNTSMITINNAGKLGKCYSFNSTASNHGIFGADITEKYINNKSWTLCAWVKSSATDTCVMSLSYGLRIFVGSSVFMAMYNSSRTVNCTATGKSTTDGKWHHIVATYNTDTNVASIYFDGILSGTVNYTAGYTYASSWSNGTFIGRDPNAATISDHYLYKGDLNDIRIYDHCLSPKEVKEISKGLVLHYKLGSSINPNMKLGSECPAFGAYSETVATKTLNVSVPEWGCNNAVRYTGVSGTSRVAFTFGDRVTSVSGVPYSFSGYIKNDSDITINITGNTGGSVDIPAKTVKYFSFVAIGNGSSYIQFNTSMPPGSTYDITVWHYKIESGYRSTPWCPNVNESLYNTLGFNDTVEYDCSGYGNNGIKYGPFDINSPSPRYSNNYQFYTGTDYITSNFFHTFDDLSISFWVLPSSDDGGYSILCSNYNAPTGGLWLATNTEGCGVWAYRGAYMKVAGLLDIDTWYHCVYTFKSGKSRWYVNGEEKTITTDTYTGTTLPIDKLTIGNSYTGTSWNTKRCGGISDFRVYATALSAEDVKELYETSGWIADNGSTGVYEFMEV